MLLQDEPKTLLRFRHEAALIAGHGVGICSGNVLAALNSGAG
jgi:hypothetical protein